MGFVVSKYKGRTSKVKDNLSEKYSVNDKIASKEIVVIGSDGSKKGMLSKEKALEMAAGENLDLVQVGVNNSVAIAKIMDFGKFLYAKKKQLSDAKKHQKVIQVKEVKMRPNIGDQDYETKLKQAVSFLKAGKKVKFTIQFRGRQMLVRNELGEKMFGRITNYLAEQEIGNLIQEKEQKSGAFWSRIYFVK